MRDPAPFGSPPAPAVQAARLQRSPAWVSLLFSPAGITVVAAVLAGGWFLARRNAEAMYSLDGLTWLQLSTRSWFTRSWASSAAILAAPAAVGFGIGWMAHRRAASAASTAVAAVAMIAFAMVQLGQKRDDDAVASKAAKPAVARPATSGPGAEHPVGAPSDGAAVAGNEAASAQARVKPEEEPATGEAVETARAAKAPSVDDVQPPPAAKPAALAAAQKKPATPAPAVETATDSASVLFGDRGRLVVQTEASPSMPTSGGPGVRPSGATAQVERQGDHPSFPGCRWATPTQWVCDGAKR